jgi:hypothetical protein
VKLNLFVIFTRTGVFFLDLAVQGLIWIKWPISLLLILLGLYAGWSAGSFAYSCFQTEKGVTLKNSLDDLTFVASIRWKNNPAQDGGPGFLFPNFENSSGSRASSQMSCVGLSRRSAYLSFFVFCLISFFSLSFALVIIKIPILAGISKILIKTNFLLSLVSFGVGPLLGESNPMPLELYLFYLPILFGLYFVLFKIYRTYLKYSRIIKSESI